MYRPNLHELTVTAFAGLLVVSTLGMVMTVSAQRSDVVPETKLAIVPKPLPNVPVDNYVFPTEFSYLASSTPILERIAPKHTPSKPAVSKVSKKISNRTTSPAIEPTSQLQRLSTPHNTEDLTTQTVSFADAFRQRVFELTNEFRVREGLKALTMSAELTKNATTYSTSMLKYNRLEHTDKLGCDLACRFLRDGYRASSWGENLAHYSFTDEPTVEEVAQFFMREWKKSAGHRANLISPVFTETGIGISQTTTNIYVTVHFALPLH